MNCEAVAERLPWLLNRSLPADEEQAVRDHIAGCAACREELGRTGWHWEATRRHLSPEVLVAHVAGESVDERSSEEEIEAHLAACKSCSEERDLLAEGRDAVERLPTVARAKMGGQGNAWRTLAIAASLFGVMLRPLGTRVNE